MGRLLNWIFKTDHYSTEAQKDRARLIYGVVLLTFIAYTVYAVAIGDDNTPTYLVRMGLDPLYLVGFIATYMLGFMAIIATRLGRLFFGAWSTLFMLYIGAVLPSLRGDFITASDSLVFAAFILVAALVNGEFGLWVAFPLSFLALAVGQIAHGDVDISDLAFVALLLIGIGGITLLFLRNTYISRVEGVSEVVEERLRLAEITTQVSRRVSRRMNLDEVLNQAVEQIRDSYSDIYHAQIFLIDDLNQDAELAASTGEVGKLLLERKHKLSVGSQSVIGQVALRGQPIIAEAGLTDSVHRRNELLPDTAVEAAFPMRMGDKVIGALDLQSKNASAFSSPGDIPIFQSLADHIAVAIDNARLFEAQASSVQENRRLYLESEANLREIQRLNQQLTKARWENYLNEKQTIKGITLEDNEIIIRSDWTESLVEAAQRRRPISLKTDEGHTVAVPITLRGESIGAIEIGLEEQVLEGDTIQMMQAVAQRLAVTLDNARLFEETQQATIQEQNVSDIVARYQSAGTVDDLLRITVTELSKSLGAHHASIRLSSFGNPAEQTNGAVAQ